MQLPQSLRALLAESTETTAPSRQPAYARALFAQFVRGFRHSLDHRSKVVSTLRLQPPPGATFPLREIVWDLETLRILMQQMLVRSHLGPADVIRAWDKSGDSELNLEEFVENVRHFFADENDNLWKTEVRPVVEEAFTAIQTIGEAPQAFTTSIMRTEARRIELTKFDTQQRRIDIVEFERWLDAPTARLEGHKVVQKTRKAVLEQTQRQMLAAQPTPRRRVLLRKKTEEELQLADRVAKVRVAAAEAAAKDMARRLSHMQRWELPGAFDATLLQLGPPQLTAPASELLLGRLVSPLSGLALNRLDSLGFIGSPRNRQGVLPRYCPSPRARRLVRLTAPQSRDDLSPRQRPPNYAGPRGKFEGWDSDTRVPRGRSSFSSDFGAGLRISPATVSSYLHGTGVMSPRPRLPLDLPMNVSSVSYAVREAMAARPGR